MKHAQAKTAKPEGQTEKASSLRVSQPGDRLELEADRVAEEVLRGPVTGGLSGAAGRPPVQRKCAACEAGGAPCPACSLSVGSGAVAGASGQLQRRPGAAAKPVANGSVKAVQAVRSGGSPLSATARNYFEPRFGTDLGSVRVHTGEVAARATAAVNARAFTSGSSIAFAPGQFDPAGSRGRRLLAHELAHVLQSSTLPVSSTIMRQPWTDFGTPPDLLGDMGLGPHFDLPQQEIDVLQFTRRFFPSNEARFACPKQGCHAPPVASDWPGHDRRVTEPRLLAWALDVGTKDLQSEHSLIALQRMPGSEAVLVQEMYESLFKMVLSPHEFAGTAQARTNAAQVLDLRRDEVRPALHAGLQEWFHREFLDALRRTPQDSDFVTRPAEYENLIVPTYLDTVKIYRGLSGHPVTVGKRFGNRFIVGVQRYGGIWFHLRRQPYFFYSTSIHAFNRWDPVLTEVSQQVAENTRFAAELLPLLVSAAGFTLGLSARLGFVIAGIALEELGEEMQRDVRGQKARSLSETLKSAGMSLLIDRVFNRAFGGSAGSLDGTAGKAAASAEERVVVKALEEPAERAVKRELADTDKALVAGALRRGDARPVKDAKLVAEGYVVEVKIVSEGQDHFYRQLADGTWCRFSKRICDIDLGADVATAARSVTEVQLESVRGTLDQIKHEIDVLGLVHDRMRRAGRRGRIDPTQLTKAEREVLDDLAPSENAADLTLAELGRLRPTQIELLGTKYDAKLDEEVRLIERLRDEARPLYVKMRAASPRTPQRDRVLRESRGLDAASRGSPRSGKLAVDHIVPLREIVDMKGFKKLHFDDQVDTVNDLENLRAIDAAANSSRGDRTWASWPQASLYYDADALARMRKLETELRSYLEQQIRTRRARRRR